jgi:CHASE2 domain-containing sensor protein
MSPYEFAFLTGLFAAGALLFAGAWRPRESTRYACAYTIAGSAMVCAVVASAVLVSRGLSVAPPIAVSLTAIGWVQATRGGVLGSIRAAFRPGRS